MTKRGRGRGGVRGRGRGRGRGQAVSSSAADRGRVIPDPPAPGPLAAEDVELPLTATQILNIIRSEVERLVPTGVQDSQSHPPGGQTVTTTPSASGRVLCYYYYRSFVCASVPMLYLTFRVLLVDGICVMHVSPLAYGDHGCGHCVGVCICARVFIVCIVSANNGINTYGHMCSY